MRSALPVQHRISQRAGASHASRRRVGLMVTVAGLVASSLVALGGASARAATPAPNLFTSLKPTRVLDTRSGIGAPAQPLAGRATLSLQVAGVAGVPLGVAAVAVNITVSSPKTSGYLTAYPSGIARPASSSVNFGAGRTVPNFAILPVGADGRVDFFNGSGGTLSLIADVSGYYRRDSSDVTGVFSSVAPARILDTRSGIGAPAKQVAKLGSVTLQVAGSGGLPATGVSAVAINLTVAAPAVTGFLTAYPAGTARPASSSLNFGAHQTVANFAIVPVSADGKITLFNGSGGTVSVIADVSGYFVGTSAGVVGAFGSVSPARILDTRTGIGAPAKPLAKQATLSLQVAGRAGVPAAGVAAVAVNLTVTGPATSGYLTAYPSGSARPLSSNVNFGAHQTVPNFAIVPVGPDGKINLFNGSGGAASVIVDVSGYFVSGAAGGSLVGWGLGFKTELGIAPGGDARVPTAAPGLPKVIAASSGADAGHAVAADGSVWSYGANTHGELGDGTTTNHFAPEQLTSLSNVIAVADGDFTAYALKSDGTVWAWGLNGFGQVGNGTTANQVSPVQVSGLSGVTAIAAGASNGYALKSDGTVWAWGNNDSAQIGDGTTTMRSTPTPVSGLANVVSIAAGAQTGYAALASGGVRAWGLNGAGQIGDGTTTQRATPVAVSGLSNVVQVAAGTQDGYALTAGGAVLAWGYNAYGQIGDGTKVNRLTPTMVTGLDGTLAVTSIAAISNTAYVLEDGVVLAWGHNTSGQVGDNGTTDRTIFEAVLTNTQTLATGSSAIAEFAVLRS